MHLRLTKTASLCATFLCTVTPAWAAVQLQNPLNAVDIQDFLFGIVSIAIVFAIPIVMVMLIYAGFLYVTARGNPEQLKQAQRALIYGIIGGVIITSAYAIIEIVQNTVNQF